MAVVSEIVTDMFMGGRLAERRIDHGIYRTAIALATQAISCLVSTRDRSFVFVMTIN